MLLSFLSLLHVFLSLAVVKLAYEVTHCDASHVTQEESNRLEEAAAIQLRIDNEQLHSSTE